MRKILIKTPSFPLLYVWMTVTNLEAMHEYVWMSICVYPKSEKKRNERERESERANVRGSCLSVSYAHFSLSLSLALFVLLKVWCYLGFKWPLFIVFFKCECTYFEVVLETINRKLSCMMIDDLSVCTRASERCFINTFIYTHTHLTRLIEKKSFE